MCVKYKLIVYFKCFLGFRNLLLVWSERKLIALLCHGGIKAWEITVKQCLSGFIFLVIIIWRCISMNTHWIKVFVAALFEVLWVIGLKHADDFWTWTGTIISIIISFYVLIMAGRKLPVGTVYAVFVGLGTAGTVISEILFFGEPFKLSKILLILLLLLGVIGLKLVTEDQVQKGADL